MSLTASELEEPDSNLFNPTDLKFTALRVQPAALEWMCGRSST